MKCPQCNGNQAYIQQAEDSHAKEVFCPECLWRCWLKFYRKIADQDAINQQEQQYDKPKTSRNFTTVPKKRKQILLPIFGFNETCSS